MIKEQSDAQKILELVLRPTLSFYPAHASYNEIHFTEFEAQLVMSFRALGTIATNQAPRVSYTQTLPVFYRKNTEYVAETSRCRSTPKDPPVPHHSPFNPIPIIPRVSASISGAHQPLKNHSTKMMFNPLKIK